MFQFGRFAFLAEYPPLADGLPHSEICGSSPLAGPHSLSQLGTSFFASGSLGIPRAPLFTYHSACPLLQRHTASCSVHHCTLLHYLLNMSKNFSAGLCRQCSEVPVKTTITSPQLAPRRPKTRDIFQKGGVPAAPSGTATLLRLSPSYRFYP